MINAITTELVINSVCSSASKFKTKEKRKMKARGIFWR